MHRNEIAPSERVKILRQEFNQLDLNHDSVLSRDELFKALDELNNGRQFDRGVAIQLYDRMDQDHDGTVSLDEFIKVFMEAEDILKQKIERADTYLQDFQKQKQEAIVKLDELKKVEQMNQYGIMLGSILTVTVVEVQDLPLNSIQEVYTKVNCEENTFQTEFVRYTGKASWNEIFTAEVRTGMEEIRVIVMSYDPRKRDEVLGEVSIPISRLKDQYRHDEIFDLQDLNGHPVSGKIHLVLQWIHSRVKYLSDVVRKWDDHIRSQIEDKTDFERDLFTLYEPFRGLLKLKGSTTTTSTRQPPKNDLQSFEKVKFSATPGASSFDAAKMANLKDGEAGMWYTYSQYGLAIMLAFAFLACFGRNTFLDVLIGLSLLFISDTFLREFYGFRGVLGALGFSAFIDLIWLGVYTHGWGSDEIRGQELSRNTLIFSLVMSYFLFFVKIGLGFVYYKLETVSSRTAGGVHHV